MADELRLAATLSQSQLPLREGEQMAYVLMEVAPVVSAPTGSVLPLNLALVLDRSGSMSGEKLDRLKEAVHLLLDRLNAQDMVSLVLFDDKVDLVVPAQPAAGRQQLHQRVEAIQERGGTQISLGMARGLEQLRQHAGAGRVSRMLLLTDGETWDDEPRCRALAEEAGAEGISISALGLGDEWNQNLLMDLAGLSGGNWEYVDRPERIIDAFEGVLRSMKGAVLANAHLTLRLVSGVTPQQVWRVAPLIDRLGQRVLSERDVQVSLGDLGQEGQSILVELVLPARPAGAYRMAQAEVTYDRPGGGDSAGNAERQKVQQDVVISYGNEAARQKKVGRVMNIVEKVSAFKLMTRALDEGERADAASRTRRLRAAATRLLDVGEVELAEQAREAAAEMAAGVQLDPSKTKKLVSATRKLDMSELLDEDET